MNTQAVATRGSTNADGQGKGGDWQSFVRWAGRFAASADFEIRERNPNLDVARQGQEAIQALKAGSSNWVAALRDAVGNSHLIPREAIADLLEWLEADAVSAGELLRQVWDPKKAATERLALFVKVFPRQHMSTPTNRRALGTFLIFLTDPTSLPYYDSDTLQTAYGLAGFAPLAVQATAIPTYVHSLKFFDVFLKEAQARQLPLRDRLDCYCAASVMARTLRGSKPTDWDDNEWDDFLSFSGQDSHGEVSASDRAVVGRLRELVAEATGAGRRGTWRKATTLLDMFGVYRLTPKVRARIASALKEGGLQASPSFNDVQRGDMVLLRLLVDPNLGTGHVLNTTDDMQITVWERGHPPSSVEDLRHRPGAVIWVDVSPQAEASRVYADLAKLCGGELTQTMVEDLLKADALPKRTNFRSETGRRVSAVSAAAIGAEDPQRENAGLSKAGSLSLWMVEVLASEGWIVTCRHNGRVISGGAADDLETSPYSLEKLQGDLTDLWTEEDFKTAGDLGTLILRGLAETYSPALRNMNAWLESWELDFFKHLDRSEHETLNELRSLVSEVGRQAHGFSPEVRQGMTRPWFETVSRADLNESIASTLDRSRTELELLADRIRGSMDLLMSRSVAKQLQISEENAQQGKMLQDNLALVTSVFLVPALVLGVYGANTALPGRDTWLGFFLMMVLAVTTGAVAYVALRRLFRGGS